MQTPDTSVQYLKGIGPHRAKLLSRMGISTIRDLLGYFPREYEDRRHAAKIATLAAGQKAVILGKVEAGETIRLNASLSVFKAAIADGTGIVFALFYRKTNPYARHDVFAKLKEDFTQGNYVYIYGQIEINFGEKQIRAEEHERYLPDRQNNETIHFGYVVPVYPLTEGVQQKWFRKLMRDAVEKYGASWVDILIPEIRNRHGFPTAPEAIRQIHFPDNHATAERARQRLAFDEFLLLETALEIVRTKNKSVSKPQRYCIQRRLLTPFREQLGFSFTHAQKKVINEIFASMEQPEPMNRLLMGDVGSGKTVVALSAILLALENGYQAAMLAPTEILAEQHFLNLSRMLEGLPVTCALMTGRLSSKKKDKRDIQKSIADGTVNLVIGTHAILEKEVQFKNLTLIVIDEQHRFGVLQRASLQQKTTAPDVLVMTATPIPRTLALTLYGDLDVSVIDSLPAGRKPVTTIHCPESYAWELVKTEIRKGRQAYIVYPLVEESDKLELKAAVKEAGELSKGIFREFRVGLLHGQLPQPEKERVMADFRAGCYDLLIATTVIEVGIDMPNATVMVIEHADRFGLATLHQLRGRIGRGTDRSFCALLGNPRSEDARKRFEIMTKTHDGFIIAEEDLALRGPGEFFGTAQHGMPALKAGNLIKDTQIIASAKTLARDIISNDPSLLQPVHAPWRSELSRLYSGRFGLSKIG